MTPGDNFVPLKRVLQVCDVSRATLWRVSRDGAEAFPKPVRQGGRLYWRVEDLAAIKSAIMSFEGRTVFDRRRATARHRSEARCAELATLKRSKAKTRRRRASARATQADLFDSAS